MWLNKRVKQSLVEGLEKQGFAIADAFLDQKIFYQIQNHLEEIEQLNLLKKAGVASSESLSLEALDRIRGDYISWLSPESANPTEGIVWQFLGELRNFLNENFYIGARSIEAHFAVYPPGAGYEKHIDQKEGTKARTITFVFYLNPTQEQTKPWQIDDGGELLIHNIEGQLLKKVLPSGNRLVLFKSDLFPHEVQAATRWRKSLTGWFRND